MLNNSAGALPTRGTPRAFFQPYADFEADFLYNGLFCDSLSLFRRDPSAAQQQPWSMLLADPTPVHALSAIAEDETAPSRLRALSCARLRSEGHAIARRAILGVVAELPFARGQDSLAAYADGSVRHIRHSGVAASFDTAATKVAARARKLVAAAEHLLRRFDAPIEQRLGPPQDGRIRITLLASDGLHVCEGPLPLLQKDPLAGPVLGNAIWLLQAQVRSPLE